MLIKEAVEAQYGCAIRNRYLSILSAGISAAAKLIKGYFTSWQNGRRYQALPATIVESHTNKNPG
jgi:hypothetical protein